MGTLFAVSFDLGRLETAGTPVPVLEEVEHESRSALAQVDFSGTSSPPGILLYRSGGAGGQPLIIQWLDGAGRVTPLLAKPGYYATPRLSSGGSRLVLQASGDIWI
jgi:hypothetical protein